MPTHVRGTRLSAASTRAPAATTTAGHSTQNPFASTGGWSLRLTRSSRVYQTVASWVVSANATRAARTRA